MLTKLKKYFKAYRGYSARYPVLVFFSVFVAGIIFWGGFNTALDVTNTETFCISCHEMEHYVYKEYQQTVHYSNNTGVRATCPDCHVPKEWQYMVVRKVGATNELFHKMIGSIDTPEKFEAKRLQLAEYVWQTMKETDSRECRNCHGFESMSLSTQKKTSQLAHKRALEAKRTCIDCHMGIAHKIAKNFDADLTLHDKFKQENRPCGDCHANMQQGEGW
ncbi:MAG: NapC/NirT family cytochrome c [Thioalkalispiraceae bacterium]